MASKRKRIGNEKAKAKRLRSFAKNAAAKVLRIADQTKREEHNRKVGSTGKHRANLAYKAKHGKTALSDPDNVHFVEVTE